MQVSKRWVAVGAVVLTGVAVAGWFVALRFRPDAAALLERLPAGADAYLVIDLERLQSNPAVSKFLADSSTVAPTADYQELLTQTGFRYQDHLKQLAAAKLGGDWVGIARVEADRARVISYMESQGAAQTQHRGTTIYAFGAERPFRLAFVSDELAVFSVGASVQLLSEALDRHSGGVTGSAGDELRRSGQLAVSPARRGLWFIARTERLFAHDPDGPRAGPFQFGQDWFEGSRTITGWIESSPLNLAVEVQSQYDSAASAVRSANAFKAVLTVLQAIPAQPAPEDGANQQDYSILLAGVTISQAAESVILHWRLDPAMLASLAR